MENWERRVKEKGVEEANWEFDKPTVTGVTDEKATVKSKLKVEVQKCWVEKPLYNNVQYCP